MKRMIVWLVAGLAALAGLLYALYRYATDDLYRRNWTAGRR
jgi:hypothetical protein